MFGVSRARFYDFFQRWKKRHIVHFDFAFGSARDRRQPTLVLSPPPPFSREIQRDTAGWHLPSGAHGEEDVWLCVKHENVIGAS